MVRGSELVEAQCHREHRIVVEYGHEGTAAIERWREQGEPVDGVEGREMVTADDSRDVFAGGYASQGRLPGQQK